MEISTTLNRDFYTSLRKKGHTHLQIIESVFPSERKEKFLSDVADLEAVDFTKKVDIEKLVSGVKKKAAKKTTKSKSKN